MVLGMNQRCAARTADEEPLCPSKQRVAGGPHAPHGKGAGPGSNLDLDTCGGDDEVEVEA